MAVELYHFWSSVCSVRCRMALQEEGLPWTSRYIDLFKFDQMRPEYLAINPRGHGAILSPFARRSKSLEVLIPILYLKGISTGGLRGEALTDSTPRDRQRRTRHAINYHALTGKTMELYLNGAHTLIGAPARLPTPQTLEGAPASVAFAVPISTATNSAQATQGSVSAQRRVSCTISPQL